MILVIENFCADKDGAKAYFWIVGKVVLDDRRRIAGEEYGILVDKQ